MDWCSIFASTQTLSDSIGKVMRSANLMPNTTGNHHLCDLYCESDKFLRLITYEPRDLTHEDLAGLITDGLSSRIESDVQTITEAMRTHWTVLFRVIDQRHDPACARLCLFAVSKQQDVDPNIVVFDLSN